MALQDKKIMPPPWLAHREIERYSIGWRMGYGEDYIYRFGDWLDTLSPDERTEYRTLFPEPVTWKGWWDDEDSSEMLEHGDFWVNAWQPEGSPKYTRQWLLQEFAAGRKREFCLFWGHQPAEDGQLTKSCLSQWWMEDFWSVANTYLCMEQYMMAGKEARVSGDFHVRFDNAYYSVPRQYVHKRVLVKATATAVQICALTGDLLSEWPRAKYKGQWMTNPEHLPANSREMAEWNGAYFTQKAMTIGSSTTEVIKRILSSKKYEVQTYRQCVGILSFARKYSKKVLEECCRQALELNKVTYARYGGICSDLAFRSASTEGLSACSASSRSGMESSILRAASSSARRALFSASSASCGKGFPSSALVASC